MEQLELVSVIMSTYNETETELRQSIESILNQTWKNIEFVIINDNPSNVPLSKLLNEYKEKDKRISVYQNKINMGLAKSLNYAIRQSKGQYIVRMDADDISFPERIEREMEYLKECCLDMVSTNRINISDAGKEVGRPGELPSGRKIEKLLPYGNPIVHPSVLVRRNVLLDMEGYRNFATAQDYDLWLRMLTAGYKIGLLDETLIYYRIRETGITQTSHYKQFLFTRYSKSLFCERKRNRNKDTYTENDMKKYIEKKYTERRKGRFDKAYDCFNKGVSNLKKRMFLFGSIYVLKAILISSDCAENIFCIMRYKIEKAKLLKMEKNN